MGVYIKDMEMPKNCYECLVRNQGFSGDGMKCGKTGSVLSWYDGNRKRMDNCHFFPVQPHGDLIDRAALFVEINKICDRRDAGIISDLTCLQQILSALRHAPTIIPAQTEKEGQ